MLDGLVAAEVDRKPVSEVRPGAILGGEPDWSATVAQRHSGQSHAASLR